MLLVVLGVTDLLSAVLVARHAAAGAAVHGAGRAAHPGRDRRRPPGRWTGSPGTSPSWSAGCRCWSGLGRAADQLAALAALGEAHRRRTLATLRIAFLSALVLELLATLSVALVAVTVGVRLIARHLGLDVGLLALLLAPEAFAPLRALGSAHHASEDAAEAAAAARAVLAAPGRPRPAGADDRPPARPRGVAVDRT